MQSAHDLLEHELAEAYDSGKRTVRALNSMKKRVGSPDLRQKLDEMRTAIEEHLRRLKDIFDLLQQRPAVSTASATRGFVERYMTLARRTKAKEAIDVVAANAAAELASHAERSYKHLMKLAEHAGATHAAPKLDDLLDLNMKESKRLAKDLDKLIDNLIDHVRPA